MYLPYSRKQYIAVDRATIQFWILLAKGHSTKASNLSFINSLKILQCPPACNLTELLVREDQGGYLE